MYSVWDVTWTATNALVISSDLCSVWEFHIFYIAMTETPCSSCSQLLPNRKAWHIHVIMSVQQALSHTLQPHSHIRVHTTPGHTHVLWERCLVATISISLFMRGVTDSWRVRLSEEDKTEDKYTVRTCMLHILVQKSTFLISITTSTFYTVHVVSGTREQIHISPASVQYTVDTCMYMLSH